MSSRKSGIWLAAQGALAVIRLGISVTDPAFDNHEFTGKNIHLGSQLSELQLGLISIDKINREFRIPVWAAESLQGTTSNFYQPFAVALFTYMGRQNSGLDLMARLQNATEYWDIPVNLFKSWVYTHSHPDLSLPIPEEQSVDMLDYGARVIVDIDGSCHVLPFYILKRGRREGLYELKLFGNLKDEASTVLCIRKRGWGQSWEPETLTVGLQTPVGIELGHTIGPTSAEQSINQNFGAWRFSLYHDGTIDHGVRHRVIKTMVTMWKDLEYILGSRAKIERLFLLDFFLHEEGSSAQEPPEVRAEPISADSETPSIRRRRQSC